MYLSKTVEILKEMPVVKGAYFLPFHIDHIKNFEWDIKYESPKSITLKDRIRHLDIQSQCGPSITAFVGDTPVAVFGCFVMWHGVAEAWSIFSEKARRYPIAMTKSAISFFDTCEISFSLHRLQITVNSNDKRALSWAKYLKFESEGLMKQYSADKDDTFIMRRK